jgi:TonB family protein
MKRLYTTLLLCACVATAINAQDITRYYLNNNLATQSTDSATYYIKYKASENGLIHFERYCMDNQLKETGNVKDISTFIKEGEVVTYYNNGNKKEVVNYSAGLPNGVQTHYFANGNVNYKIVTNSAGYGESLKKESTTKYLFCANSKNEITLQDGNGTFTSYDENLNVIEEGAVKNTSADGAWKGFDNNKIVFTEVYKNGNLVKGQNYATDGNVYVYQQRNKRPEPKGGINNFYNYIAASMQNSNLSNAKIMLKFTVDVSGNVKNVEVVNSSDKTINSLAINAVKTAPKWNPALEQGKPVQAAYYMPISIQY